RDRFGIKPLFYAEYKQTLYLASEAKALFAAGVPARWNVEALSGCLAFSGQQTRTLFDGVFQVPPGHYLIASDQGVQLKKYWDFDYPQVADYGPARSDEDYTEEFKLALEEAVRLRLRADVPVGCYLSGGIDSCAVLGLAARHHSGPVRAFTLTFDRSEYDEGAVAREMATKAGADFVPIPIRQDDLADHFVPAIVQAETLCVNAHGVAKYLLSKAVNNAGYKVVLTGEGSDEVLGGYLHFRRDAAIHNGNGHDTDGIRRILGFVPYWIEVSAAQSEKLQEVIGDKFLQSQQSDGEGKIFGEIDVPGQLSGRDRLNQSLYLWAKTRLPNYILTLLGDRMEMAHSVEGRLPFLDHKLVELTRSYPGTQKIRGGIQKYVLRESMRDVITDTVYRRPKHPFLAPPAALNLESRLSSRIQDTLRGPVLTSIPFFERAKVLRLLDNLPAMDEGSRVANDPVLMVLLSACALQEGFQLAS
ncbi:MAG: asparagine synthase (glutamine-hydrolyzing), partial [Acidobacteriales bacterium]|nr:asparagine synthase (glutamine-hydrolyzing) [Terriglobales bacterium]